MNSFLLIIFGLTLFASVLILSKYIDFAMFMIKRKDEEIQPRVIQFSQPKFRSVQKNKNNDIVIDIPVHEVTVVKRE